MNTKFQPPLPNKRKHHWDHIDLKICFFQPSMLSNWRCYNLNFSWLKIKFLTFPCPSIILFLWQPCTYYSRIQIFPPSIFFTPELLNFQANFCLPCSSTDHLRDQPRVLTARHIARWRLQHEMFSIHLFQKGIFTINFYH